MHKLASTVQTDSRKLVEDLYDFLGTIVRGWRLIAVCVGITLALAVIYLARVKPVYLASARLLVLQHGGTAAQRRQWRLQIITTTRQPARNSTFSGVVV